MAGKYVFDGYDNPTLGALHAVDPTFVPPVGYTGFVEDTNLAAAMLTLVARGTDFETLLDRTSDYRRTRLQGVEGLEALFARFEAPAASFLYYTLLNDLTTNPGEIGHAWYYMLNLAVNYGEAVIEQVPTVQGIISTEYAKGDPFPSPALLGRIEALNTRLSREGVVFDLEELYICVERIDAGELLQALAANFDVDHIIPLVRVGLVTADEIIAHRDDLPVDWLNMLLGESAPEPLEP